MGKIFLILIMGLTVIWASNAQTDGDTTKSSISVIDDEQIYTEVEVMPEYPGGQSQLMQYLASIPYPADARKKKLEGTVYVQIVIEKDGSISNVQVSKSSGHAMLDEATVAHISAMARWKPGLHKGKPVRVQYTLPMRFKLG